MMGFHRLPKMREEGAVSFGEMLREVLSLTFFYRFMHTRRRKTEGGRGARIATFTHAA